MTPLDDRLHQAFHDGDEGPPDPGAREAVVGAVRARRARRLRRTGAAAAAVVLVTVGAVLLATSGSTGPGTTAAPTTTSGPPAPQYGGAATATGPAAGAGPAAGTGPAVGTGPGRAPATTGGGAAYPCLSVSVGGAPAQCVVAGFPVGLTVGQHLSVEVPAGSSATLRADRAVLRPSGAGFVAAGAGSTELQLVGPGGAVEWSVPVTVR